MGSLLSKALGRDPAWDAMPWRRWKSPAEQLRVLPTFVVCEWSFRTLAVLSFIHARRTGQLRLWFSAWLCGTANDVFFMFMPFCDNFWQAQASVMLTPRLPLYIVEMYAVVLYCSATAARKFQLPVPQEIALAGLFAHVTYHVYDVNGPRFLWWTWHDADPAISVRQSNAPVGSSVWILTYCALHAALFRYSEDASAQLAPRAAEFAMQVPQAGLRKLLDTGLDVLRRVDTAHAALTRAPAAVKIAACGAVCTPAFMVAMGIAQIASLDRIGVPGTRTYRIILAAYAAALGGHAALAGQLPRVPAAQRRPEDAMLFRGLAAFYALQVLVTLAGDPEAHVSTGCHQTCSDDGEQAKDIMGWPRNEHVPSDGPKEHSRFDYRVAQLERDPTRDGAGRPVVPPSPVRGDVARDWYSVVGVKHKNAVRERGTVLLFAAAGLAMYRRALAS